MDTYNKIYLITIYNASDALAYKQEIKARNENEAIRKVLEQVVIYEGDKIMIEEA